MCCGRFGIICSFVSNVNSQDGIDTLPTALRHTTEDTATYFNHTRKVDYIMAIRRRRKERKKERESTDSISVVLHSRKSLLSRAAQLRDVVYTGHNSVYRFDRLV